MKKIRKYSVKAIFLSVREERQAGLFVDCPRRGQGLSPRCLFHHCPGLLPPHPAAAASSVPKRWAGQPGVSRGAILPSGARPQRGGSGLQGDSHGCAGQADEHLLAKGGCVCLLTPVSSGTRAGIGIWQGVLLRLMDGRKGGDRKEQRL